MMSTQEQIKKIINEEFSEEVNEIFGLGKNRDTISSLDPRPLSGKAISLSIKLPRSVRKTLINAIASALSSNPDSIDAAKEALEKYKSDPDIRTFIDFLEKVKRTPPAPVNEGVKEELTDLIKKSGTNDYGLTLVAQILTSAGLQTGISEDNLATLSAIADPNSALPSANVSGDPSSSDATNSQTPDADGGTQDGADPAGFAVPLYKKHSGEQQRTGAPRGSLSSKLMKMLASNPMLSDKQEKNIKSAITAIVKDIEVQLKANKIQIQELNKRQVKTAVKKLELGPGDVKKYGKTRWFVAKNLDGKNKAFQNQETAKRWAKGPTEQPAEQPKEDPFTPKQGTSGRIYTSLSKIFKQALKILDLDTPEGREGAKQTDAAYVGAYRFYKTMKTVLKTLNDGRLDKDSPGKMIQMLKLKKKFIPLNEQEGLDSVEKESLKKELETLIKQFEDEKLIDSTPQKGGGTVASQRAIKAIRAGRGAKDAKDKPYTPADIKTTGGTVNAKQSVGPRLRAAGFKIKSYDGEPTVGSRLQKQILRVVRQFLKTNMKRIGKDDIKVISEEIINELYNRGVFK